MLGLRPLVGGIHGTRVRWSSNFQRPGPPPLPQRQQREFEELQKQATQDPTKTTSQGQLLHPDARQPLKQQFEGQVNPETGEKGGPKQEPVSQSGEDWSFKGRVSDF